MDWTTINLNHNIRFRLTELGMKILADEYNHFARYYPDKELRTKDYYAAKQDEAGYYEMQMWCFIESFGKHIGMGKEPVIEKLNIQVNSTT